MQADQPGRAFRRLPAKPGPGLRHDLCGPLNRDRQLIQRPAHPAAHPSADRFGQGPAAVAQHRGGLRRGFLRQISEFTGHPLDHPGAFLTGKLAPGDSLPPQGQDNNHDDHDDNDRPDTDIHG
jgi:hypothetical protein